MVDVVPICADEEYEVALKEIERLIKALPGTSEGNRLDALVTLVQVYETEHHAVDAPNLIALTQFVTEQRELGHADLRPPLGKPHRG